MRDIRFIAEWEPQSGVMLTYPSSHTDWAYMLSEVRQCYGEIVRAFTADGIDTWLLCAECDIAEAEKIIDSPYLHVIPMLFNDTWVRDYGAISVVKDGRIRALDFGFNGWGLKFPSDRDNLVNLRLRDGRHLPVGTYRNERDFTLEGGSVETDGEGTVMTTTRCLCSENRNGGHTKEEINRILRERLGAEHVLWLDYGALEGDDTDSHIDTLARLCPNNLILYTGCRDENDGHFEELLKMKAQLMMFRTMEGEPYSLLELPLPQAIYDEEGNRLPATYCNYLVTDKTVFVPTYGQPANDDLAMKIINLAYPERNVKGIDCRALIHQHGSLHCATMQFPQKLVIET